MTFSLTPLPSFFDQADKIGVLANLLVRTCARFDPDWTLRTPGFDATLRPRDLRSHAVVKVCRESLCNGESR